MKNYKIYILSFLLALGFSACETVDFGDTNDNPNGPTMADPAPLMSGAMVQYSNRGGRDYLLKPTLYVQYQSQSVYTDEMRYNEVASPWYTYYGSELSELNEMINFVSNPDNQTASVLSQGAIVNQVGVAKIFMSVIFKRITDTWGDVPYTEALQGLDNLSPAYSDQKSVYEGLITTVKEGRDMLDESLLGPTGDVIYDGNITKWKKFANSLIMQMSLQLSNTSIATYARTEFNAALSHSSGVLEDIADDALFTYHDVKGQRNPFNSSRPADYYLSKELTDAMHGTGTLNPTSNTTPDFRLAAYSNNMAHDGRPYGYSTIQTGDSNMNISHFWNASASLPLLTSSYTFLNRAEAANLGWTTEDATAMLVSGITLSYQAIEKKIDTTLGGDVTVYAAARVADASTFSLAQVIGEEKWVSLFPNGFDAWSEWRRTGFPALNPATDYLNNGQIPRRYIYPTDEAGVNTAGYNAGVSSLTPATDNNTSKIWWNQ